MSLRTLTKIAARARASQPQFTLSSILQIKLFSTEGRTADHESDFLCSYKANQKLRDLKTDTPDFQRRDGPFHSPELDVMIEKAQTAASERFDLGNLKEVYASVVRPELVSRLLMHRYPLDHTCTHWLNYQTHALMKKMPRFTSSYDVMLRLMELPKSSWVYFLNYLSEERIGVLDNLWEPISAVKHMFYQHGPQDMNGIHFIKGEADASWHESTQTADISFLIWDTGKVIDAQTYLGLTSDSTVDSEAKAALTVLKRAEELSIPNFILWIDSAKVEQVFAGKNLTSKDKKHLEIFNALKSMRASFQRLIVNWVPRRLLTFADGMLRDPSVKLAKETQIMYPRFAKQSATNWAYELNGLPIFDLSMTEGARSTVKTFGKPLFGEPTQMKYFIEVAENMKLSALFNVMKTLDPPTVYLAIHEIETKEEDILNGIYDLMGNSISVMHDKWSILSRGQDLNFQGSVLINFDGLCLMDGPDVELTISFCSDENKAALITDGYMELSASAYIHYHGSCSPKGLI